MQEIANKGVCTPQTVSTVNASEVNEPISSQFSTIQAERQEILHLLEERKARYAADRMALQREMRELRKEYRRQNAEMNRQLKELAPKGRGKSRKSVCYSIQRLIGQMLLGIDSATLDAPRGKCRFEMYDDRVEFVITINNRVIEEA